MNSAGVPHGFRSSFRDWASEETDHPREVVEAALAHVVKNQRSRQRTAARTCSSAGASSWTTGQPTWPAPLEWLPQARDPIGHKSLEPRRVWVCFRVRPTGALD